MMSLSLLAGRTVLDLRGHRLQSPIVFLSLKIVFILANWVLGTRLEVFGLHRMEMKIAFKSANLSKVSLCIATFCGTHLGLEQDGV